MKSIIALICLFGQSLFVCAHADSAPGTTLCHESFEVKTINLSTGVTLEYVEKGSPQKTAIIFLHGYSDSWYSFKHILSLLPDDIYGIALTQRGHGNSSKPAHGYHPVNFAGDVSAFIKAKKLGPCIVVGHSMGGIVAQQFALKYPSLAKAMVIIDSDAQFADNAGMPEFRDEVLKLTEPLDYSFAEAFQKSTITRPVDSLSLQTWISESMKLPVPVWKEIIRGLMAVDYSSQLPKIKIPALVFWGDRDAICPKESQQELIGNLRNVKYIEYEGTGHALHWEEPQRFVNDLVSFVRANKLLK